LIKKILFTGPESTGKSTLAKVLANQYNTVWVPEYARSFLEKRGGKYIEADLLTMAQEQLAQEKQATTSANQFLFCDTAMLVIKIWSEYKYGRCHPWILEQWNQSQYDHIFLCNTDIPWEPDPLRENPNEREDLLAMYKSNLQDSGKNFTILQGTLEQRITSVNAYLR
jgi:NadR type nicotinamide-nucleotide adenylyltransferase